MGVATARSPMMNPSELDANAAVIHELMTSADHLAAQLEEARGSEYRLRLARALALALCDALHELEDR
jgi:hypothetical protein